jgi:hypothetical protein
MPIAEFPLPSVSSSNPRPMICYQVAEKFAVSKSPAFQDGAVDVNLDSELPTRQWVLIYRGITEAEAAILDAHHALAFHDAMEFNFRDPVTTTLHSNCRYLEYTRRHERRRTILDREITIIKYP